jgi:hypothetical protein
VKIDGLLMRESAARWYFNGSVEKRVDKGTLHLNITKVNGTEVIAGLPGGGYVSNNPSCAAAGEGISAAGPLNSSSGVPKPANESSPSLKTDDGSGGPDPAHGVWVTAAAPIELGRSRPMEALMDPVFVEAGGGQLLVTASSSPSRNAARVFAALDTNASKWTELSAPSLAALNHSLGICLPSAAGTICLASDAVELPTSVIHCSPKAHPPKVCHAGVIESFLSRSCLLCTSMENHFK